MSITQSKPVEYALIYVDRESRQRRELTGIEELRDSIRKIGLLQPVVIDKDYKLLVGERRYTAWGLLHTEDPKKYAKISARFISDLTPAERALVELEENIKRHQLHWKDECLAVLSFHTLMQEAHEGWSYEKSLEELNITHVWFYKQIAVGKALKEGNKKVAAADGTSQAYNIIKREQERATADALNELTDLMRDMSPEKKEEAIDAVVVASLDAGSGTEATEKVQTSKGVDAAVLPVVSSSLGNVAAQPTPTPQPEESIINVDFTEWIKSYTGKRFNLLHCDLPYGINHQDSDQGGAERWGSYEDSPEVYFDLCRTITSNLDKILYPSAHVLFWFSMTHYQWTMEHFTSAGLAVNPFPLVWWKTDNKGLLPDHQRGPRRVYETAFLMSRGDRKINEAVANAYGAPTAKASALHLSEKPVPVLEHFMRMLVDDFTEMLDPTCGSGSALRAAERRNAKRVVGLERDPEFARLARTALAQDRTLRRISSKVKESTDG